MAKKRKLTERRWVIRIGTFKNSEPYFLTDLDSGPSAGPLTWKTREAARSYKRGRLDPEWIKSYWAIVCVDVKER